MVTSPKNDVRALAPSGHATNCHGTRGYETNDDATNRRPTNDDDGGDGGDDGAGSWTLQAQARATRFHLKKTRWGMRIQTAQAEPRM